MTTTGRIPDSTPGLSTFVHHAHFLDIKGPPGSEGVLRVRIGLWLPNAETKPRSLPMMIYAPGWGDGFDDNLVLLRSIASHGFGVLAIDDIARDPIAPWARADDESARLAAFDVSTEDRRIQLLEDADRRVRLASQKVTAVLDAVSRTQNADPRLGLFDLDRVAAVGASFGGATMSEAALTDGRIALIVNLDGLVFGHAASQVIPKPMLEFNSTLGSVPITDLTSTDAVRRFSAHLNVQQIARQQRQLASRRDAFELTVHGSRHQDFTNGLYERARALSWRPWRSRPISPARMRLIVDTLVVAGLQEWMLGQFGKFTRFDMSQFSEVTVERGRGD